MQIESIDAQVDLNRSIPNDGVYKFAFSKENKQEAFTQVASFVCQVYDFFLKSGNKSREGFCKQGIKPSHLHDKLIISDTECQEFQACLKNEITNTINKKKHPEIELITDYTPEGILLNICTAVFKNGWYTIPKILPYNTYTRIELSSETQITVTLRLR